MGRVIAAGGPGGDLNQFNFSYKSGLNPCSRIISKAENWHDDLMGFVYSRGVRFSAAVLHTGHWKSGGQGYGLKYTSKW